MERYYDERHILGGKAVYKTEEFERLVSAIAEEQRTQKGKYLKRFFVFDGIKEDPWGAYQNCKMR